MVDGGLGEGGGLAGWPADFDVVDLLDLAEAEVEGVGVLGAVGVAGGELSGGGEGVGVKGDTGAEGGGGEEVEADPVVGGGDLIFEDAESELRVGKAVVAGEDEVRFSVLVEVIGDDVAAVFLEADSEEVSDVGEAVSGLV